MITYTDAESSLQDAQPVELYRFVHGLDSYCFTSADVPCVFKGETYEPEAISRSTIDQSQEDQAGSLEVSMPRECAVAALFIAYLPSVPVKLYVYRTHRNSPDVVQTFQGTVVSATYTENECKLRCAANADILSRIIPIAIYQPQCNHVLFSTSNKYDLEGGTRAQNIGCNADKAAFRVPVQVYAVDELTVSGTGLGDKPEGWFAYGYVERVRDGDVRWITQHTGSSIELSYPFKDLGPGEVLYAYPGCDRLESTCRSKFNNVVHFGGFTRMPAKNPFTNSIQ